MFQIQQGAPNQSNRVEEIANYIAKNCPSLSDLSNEQLIIVGELVLQDKLKNEMSEAVKLSSVDYLIEKEIFLQTSGRTGSKHTQRTYKRAIYLLEQYTILHSLKILALSYEDADNFIYHLSKQENLSGVSINIYIAALSKFYASLERRFELHNPFFGARKPKKLAVRKFAVPTTEEVEIILDHAAPLQRAILNLIIYRGFRIGALPKLDIFNNGQFRTFSKGKFILGRLPTESLQAIKKAKLPTDKPFISFTTNSLSKKINYLINKLHEEGKIKERYSPHDFRHFYTIQQYQIDKDVKRIQTLLFHENLATTDTYLKSLNLTE